MNKQKVAIIGSGIVGQVLAKGFEKYGYPVMIASRSPEKLESWKNDQNFKGSLGTFHEAAKYGDIIVLAVKGTAAEKVAEGLDAQAISGKTLIDATNPIADKEPQNGVLQFFTSQNDSLLERLQKQHPKTHFVKAFNSVGNAFMIDPEFKDGKPTMFICGNNEDAKKAVSSILHEFGWESEDMGSAEAARAIEPLCMLWCIPGFLRNEWTHAFKLLKK